MSSPPPPTAAPRPLLDPPGGLLIWLIVTLELGTFGIIGGVLAALRAGQPATFHAGQAALAPAVGLAYTVALVTSGWLAAEAVHAGRARRRRRARALMIAAIAAGLVFVGLKLHDGAALLGAGFGLSTDDFWMGYFFATGFHLVHVLVGLVLLAVAAVRVGGDRPDDDATVTALVLFWHMCDLAWFLLLALLYTRS